jgi:hypothetical protein
MGVVPPFISVVTLQRQRSIWSVIADCFFGGCIGGIIGLLLGSAIGGVIFTGAVLLRPIDTEVFTNEEVFFFAFKLPIPLCAAIGWVIGVYRSLRGKKGKWGHQ